MHRLFLAATLAALLALASAWSAFTQSRPPRPAAVQRVADDLYMLTGEGGNVAAYVTAEGVVLVDDMYARNADDVLAKVKTVTDRPVKYVLNTHQHEDHAGGNVRMLPIAEVIAHENARANLSRLGAPGLPRLTFSDRFDVHLGAREVRANHYGRGHTGGDAVVFFPQARAIHTGDLFLSGPVIPRAPGGGNIFIDYAEGGSIVEWTHVLDEVLKLDFETVIPGHGPLATKADVVKFRAAFDGMRARVAGLLHQGKDKEDVTRVLVDEYGWPAGGLAIAQVDSLIAELRSRQ